MPDIPSPGSIVQVRGREWVTLPQNRAGAGPFHCLGNVALEPPCISWCRC